MPAGRQSYGLRKGKGGMQGRAKGSKHGMHGPKARAKKMGHGKHRRMGAKL